MRWVRTAELSPTTLALAKLSCTMYHLYTTFNICLNQWDFLGPHDLIPNPNTLLKSKDASPGRQTLDKFQTKQLQKTCTSTFQHLCLVSALCQNLPLIILGRICGEVERPCFLCKWFLWAPNNEHMMRQNANPQTGAWIAVNTLLV